ncbi:hypothetical protein GE061_005579 [Apolygus lucorum]|uniref:Uncharacterized protein n=1 Tax=Apolygus lucorum TaxID=248454 RepID=A0A8S9WWM0_APOLU|nr:hypothetical protein GE061_005579 [Apolygus lucorum]
MKFIVFAFFALVAICLVQSGYAQCLASGASCTYDGTFGNCCSGMCNQGQNDPSGTCSSANIEGDVFVFLNAEVPDDLKLQFACFDAGFLAGALVQVQEKL